MMIKFSSSFGQLKNMSYNFGDNAEVKSNVDEFLKQNGFSSQSKLVTATPIHENKFVILDEETYRGLEGKDFSNRSIDADGIITNLKNVPICFKPADCAVVGLDFTSPFVKGGLRGISPIEYFGLLHIGFDDYLNGIVSKFSEFVGACLVPVLGQPQGLSLQIQKIQVFPFLQKYRIDYGDFQSDKYDWDSLGIIQEFIEEDENGRYVNFHHAVWQELCKFWPAGIIEFDERDASTHSINSVQASSAQDTFSLAKERKCFSHSLSNFHPEFQNGRNCVVGEIIAGL